MKFAINVMAVLFLSVVSACATYKTTLTDAEGKTITCEASGKSGIITGHYLRRGFEECVAAAKAQGYGKEKQ